MRKEKAMPDHEELESILDRQDTIARRDRTLPWRKEMEPSPESDEADEAEEAGRRSESYG